MQALSFRGFGRRHFFPDVCAAAGRGEGWGWGRRRCLVSKNLHPTRSVRFGRRGGQGREGGGGEKGRGEEGWGKNARRFGAPWSRACRPLASGSRAGALFVAQGAAAGTRKGGALLRCRPKPRHAPGRLTAGASAPAPPFPRPPSILRPNPPPCRPWTRRHWVIGYAGPRGLEREAREPAAGPRRVREGRGEERRGAPRSFSLLYKTPAARARPRPPLPFTTHRRLLPSSLYTYTHTHTPTHPPRTGAHPRG
jgi:hypothetical protein